MKRLIAALVLFFLLPLVSFAVDGTFLIPSWQNPSPSSNYLFSNHVVVNGAWQLPPDWAGNIYVYGDATVDGGGALISAGTQKTDINTGQAYYSITNPTVASTSGTFSFDIGPQADGLHNVYIKFVGGAQCAVNTQSNALYGTTYMPTCAITSENAAFNLLWGARDYTVQLPPFPRMTITPASDPALIFSNIVFGSTQTLPFSVSNTGGQTLTGSISGISTPFSCTPSCAYTLNPGVTATINITFAPLTSPTSYDQTIQFSCAGTGPVSNGCEGGPDNTIAYQSRHIIGNSVDNAISPIIQVTPTSVNYSPNPNLGVGQVDKTMTIKNNGGGILNGNITFTTTEYTCVGNPSCSYSLFAGQSTTIVVRYIPVVAGAHADSASFTGGGGQVVPLNSTVNDKPILSVHSADTPANFGTNINVGNCVNRNVHIRNSGAGFLTGTVSSIPLFPASTATGFSCVTNCSYNNLTNTGSWTTTTFRLCPLSDTPVSENAIFTNDNNPPAGGTVPLSGQGNILPIGVFSGTSQINFGPTLVGTTKTASVTIMNTGVGVLSGTVGALPYPANQTCISGCTYNIPAGGTQVITISFTPTAVQDYGGNVTIPGVGTSYLWASGVQPDFKMSYDGSTLTMCPGTTCVTDLPQKTYNVGATTFGGSLSVQNKTFYLYVGNSGTGANVNYTLPNTTHFFCMSSCSGAIAPGTELAIPYQFQPSAATSYNEPLLVSYDYGDAVPRSVTLDLEGSSISAPYLSVTPSANIPLGDVPVGGAPAVATFTVTNDGVGPLDYNVTIPTIGAGAPTLGLNYHWTFDNANIDWATHAVTDMTGNGNTGFLPGPISDTGKIAEALKFTSRGGVKVAKVNGLASGNAPHTISAWIKVTALTPARQWILMLGSYAGGNHHWLLNNGGGTAFGVWGGSQVSPTLPSGTWVHVTTTYDGTTLKSYVNGALSQTTSANFTLQNVSGGVPLYIGLRDTGLYPTEYDFNGTLDDVRIYNTALSASEVSQVYTNVYPQTASLVEWLKFDDATIAWSQLKAYDSSGKGNDGTLSDVPTSVAGKIGEAFDFKALYSSSVTTSNLVTNPVDFTIGAWFKTTSASGKKIVGFENTKVLVSSGSDRSIWMGADGKVRFGVWNGSTQVITSTNTLNDGAWHHAVGTHAADGTTKFYIDGVLQGSLNSTVWNDSGYWRIGGYRGGSWPSAITGHFVGSIDDVRIYNRPLSATEVSDLYGSGVAVDISAFSCVSGCNFVGLLPAQSQNVVFNFSPTAAMGYLAYPMFASTNGGGTVSYPAAPYPSISGTGVLDPIISVTPSSLGFADTNQGLSSQQMITIENTGLGNLSGSISPVKTPGLNFYCLSGCNFNISAGGSATAMIEFAPQSTGPLADVITVNSNGVNIPVSSGIRGREAIDVFGTGTFAPIIDIRGGDTNYGPVVIGKYKDRTFTIKNTGSVDLGTGVFSITGPFTCVDPVDTTDGLCHYNITAGAEVNVTIRFSPTVVGPASGAVWLSGVPLARFFVNGSGVSPSVKFIEQ